MAGSKSLIAVQLHRSGTNQPWGFRLQGGVEHGQLLTVQRISFSPGRMRQMDVVFMQSPSEQILHRGDIVVRINDFDASRMRLQEAEEICNNSILALRLEVQRSSTPESPQPQPLSNHPSMPAFQRQQSNPQQYQQYQQYQQEQQQKFQQSQPQQPSWQNSPTLAMIQQQGASPTRGAPRWERQESTDDSDTPAGIRRLANIERSKKTGVLDHVVPLPNLDQLGVKNQTYRTNQLISPAPKAKHFRPMGSYLNNSFGRQNVPQPQAAHDSQYTQYTPNNTRSFNRGQQRPKSFYDQPSNSYGSTGNLSPYPSGGSNGWSRESLSPAPPQQLGGGRQWPPSTPTPQSPPPSYQPANPFTFAGQNNGYQQPQEQHQQYQQPQQQYQQQQQYQPYQQPPQHTAQLPFEIPQTGTPGKKIVHSQFNSPAGLYSTQNAVDMFAGQTGLRPNQVSGKGKPLSDFKESPTYQLLMAQGQQPRTAWGQAPRQSRALASLDSGYGASEL